MSPLLGSQIHHQASGSKDASVVKVKFRIHSHIKCWRETAIVRAKNPIKWIWAKGNSTLYLVKGTPLHHVMVGTFVESYFKNKWGEDGLEFNGKKNNFVSLLTFFPATKRNYFKKKVIQRENFVNSWQMTHLFLNCAVKRFLPFKG